MAKSDPVLHPDFKPRPYWWEAYTPGDDLPTDVPAEARVAIVGGGYAGLSCALEIARRGIAAVVLESGDLGFGASTRNGGAVSGGPNVGKGFTGRGADRATFDAVMPAIMDEAAESYTLFEYLVDHHNIDCGFHRTGRFSGAWTPKHYQAMAARVDQLNRLTGAKARLLPRERQREEIASDYYHGGMTVDRAGHIHPALYYKGLLDAARAAGALVCSKAEVVGIDRTGAGWRVRTRRGEIQAGDVVIATNGYTGGVTPKLKRRLVPIASHIIATEPLPPDLARSLLPTNRSVGDTKRILTYYRLSPDGTRLIFGGRAKFTQVDATVSAPILHRFMTDRFPQLNGTRVTHAWTGNVAFTLDYLPHMGEIDGMHYALGCNGSGVTMMTWLGYQTARKLLGGANHPSAFARLPFPDHPLYGGNPWFLPAIGGWYRLRDSIDRMLA